MDVFIDNVIIIYAPNRKGLSFHLKLNLGNG